MSQITNGVAISLTLIRPARPIDTEVGFIPQITESHSFEQFLLGFRAKMIKAWTRTDCGKLILTYQNVQWAEGERLIPESPISYEIDNISPDEIISCLERAIYGKRYASLAWLIGCFSHKFSLEQGFVTEHCHSYRDFVTKREDFPAHLVEHIDFESYFDTAYKSSWASIPLMGYYSFIKID